jgi:hypothetical protein
MPLIGINWWWLLYLVHVYLPKVIHITFKTHGNVLCAWPVRYISGHNSYLFICITCLSPYSTGSVSNVNATVLQSYSHQCILVAAVVMSLLLPSFPKYHKGLLHIYSSWSKSQWYMYSSCGRCFFSLFFSTFLWRAEGCWHVNPSWWWAMSPGNATMYCELPYNHLLTLHPFGCRIFVIAIHLSQE